MSKIKIGTVVKFIDEPSMDVPFHMTREMVELSKGNTYIVYNISGENYYVKDIKTQGKYMSHRFNISNEMLIPVTSRVVSIYE